MFFETKLTQEKRMEFITDCGRKEKIAMFFNCSYTIKCCTKFYCETLTRA